MTDWILEWLTAAAPLRQRAWHMLQFLILYASFMYVCLYAWNDELKALKEPICVRVWHMSACLDEGIKDSLSWSFCRLWIITHHSKIRRRISALQLYFLQCPTQFDMTASYVVILTHYSAFKSHHLKCQYIVPHKTKQCSPLPVIYRFPYERHFVIHWSVPLLWTLLTGPKGDTITLGFKCFLLLACTVQSDSIVWWSQSHFCLANYKVEQ